MAAGLRRSVASGFCDPARSHHCGGGGMDSRSIPDLRMLWCLLQYARNVLLFRNREEIAPSPQSLHRHRQDADDHHCPRHHLQVAGRAQVKGCRTAVVPLSYRVPQVSVSAAPTASTDRLRRSDGGSGPLLRWSQGRSSQRPDGPQRMAGRNPLLDRNAKEMGDVALLLNLQPLRGSFSYERQGP